MILHEQGCFLSSSLYFHPLGQCLAHNRHPNICQLNVWRAPKAFWFNEYLPCAIHAWTSYMTALWVLAQSLERVELKFQISHCLKRKTTIASFTYRHLSLWQIQQCAASSSLSTVWGRVFIVLERHSIIVLCRGAVWFGLRSPSFQYQGISAHS